MKISGFVVLYCAVYGIKQRRRFLLLASTGIAYFS
jgi:hypothetical protein